MGLRRPPFLNEKTWKSFLAGHRIKLRGREVWLYRSYNGRRVAVFNDGSFSPKVIGGRNQQILYTLWAVYHQDPMLNFPGCIELIPRRLQAWSTLVRAHARKRKRRVVRRRRS